MHRVVPPMLKAVWRPAVRGLDHVPDRGGVLIASNHLSFVDSVVIPTVAPRKVHFLAKADYFTGAGLRGAASRRVTVATIEEALDLCGVDRLAGCSRESER